GRLDLQEAVAGGVERRHAVLGQEAVGGVVVVDVRQQGLKFERRRHVAGIAPRGTPCQPGAGLLRGPSPAIARREKEGIGEMAKTSTMAKEKRKADMTKR